jgi:hypothetical protein
VEVVQRRFFATVEYHHRDVGRCRSVVALLCAGLWRYRNDLERRIAETVERRLDLGTPILVLSDQKNPERAFAAVILFA